MIGKVYQLNRKPQTPGERGLPKQEVQAVLIKEKGMDGDYNNYRQEKKNGDPNKALLLLPLETLEDLDNDGWPVQPGDLGENITTRGIRYELFQPHKLYKIGEALIAISQEAQSCINLAVLPYVGDKNITEFMAILKGRRGWYAKVMQEGIVKKGDHIEQFLF